MTVIVTVPAVARPAGVVIEVVPLGVTVPQLNRIEFDDVLQNRLLLEGEAAERGAARLTPAAVLSFLPIGLSRK